MFKPLTISFSFCYIFFISGKSGNPYCWDLTVPVWSQLTSFEIQSLSYKIVKQDLDRLDVGQLTLCPFSPGSPGSPSKPLSPCTSTDQCHYITTYPSHGEIGAAWRFTPPWLLARRAFHAHRQLQVGPKTKERMKKKKQPSFTNPKACLLTFIDLRKRDISCNCPAPRSVVTKAPLLDFSI